MLALNLGNKKVITINVEQCCSGHEHLRGTCIPHTYLSYWPKISLKFYINFLAKINTLFTVLMP